MDYAECGQSALAYVEKLITEPYVSDAELRKTEQVLSTIKRIMFDVRKKNAEAHSTCSR